MASSSSVLHFTEGAILFIDELSQEHVGRTVRTVGYVRRQAVEAVDDAAVDDSNDNDDDTPPCLAREGGERTLVVEFKDGRMQVDAALIHPDLHFHEGDLYQFIGELVAIDAGLPRLRARVVRCVEGLDFNLYEQAVMLFRQYVLQGRKCWSMND